MADGCRLGYLHGQFCWDLLVLWGMLPPVLAAPKAEQVLDGRHSIGEGTNKGLPGLTAGSRRALLALPFPSISILEFLPISAFREGHVTPASQGPVRRSSTSRAEHWLPAMTPEPGDRVQRRRFGSPPQGVGPGGLGEP